MVWIPTASRIPEQALEDDTDSLLVVEHDGGWWWGKVGKRVAGRMLTDTRDDLPNEPGTPTDTPDGHSSLLRCANCNSSSLVPLFRHSRHACSSLRAMT